jgi:hypothetical protein
MCSCNTSSQAASCISKLYLHLWKCSCFYGCAAVRPHCLNQECGIHMKYESKHMEYKETVLQAHTLRLCSEDARHIPSKK